MITLHDLIESTSWRDPQEHIKIALWYPENVYDDDKREFVDIEFNVRSALKYKNYIVHDIDIEMSSDNEPILICLLTVPKHNLSITGLNVGYQDSI